MLTFDPTKIQLKKQTPRPQQKPAPAAQESEIAKIQLKKATPVEKPAPKPSGGGFDLSQVRGGGEDGGGEVRGRGAIVIHQSRCHQQYRFN